MVGIYFDRVSEWRKLEFNKVIQCADGSHIGGLDISLGKKKRGDNVD